MDGSSRFDDAYRAISFSHEKKTTLCAPFLSALPITGVSISILGGRVGESTVCASDDEAARLDELQFDLGEGPCWQALSTRAPVLADDLQSGAHPAWPLFAEAVRGRDVGALFAFPLTVGALGLGAVDLYSRRPRSLDDSEIAGVTSLARVTAWQVLRRVLRDEPDAATDDIENDDPYSRREFHQATGMVLVQLGIDAADASLLIRAHAFAAGRPVIDVARDIVDRQLTFNDEEAP